MTQNEQSLYDEIKSSTNIISGKEFKEILLAISQIANDMVKDTLGPYGSTTIIDDSTFTYPTKDGFTVLKGLRFNDPIYNVLYNILKQISFNIVSKVGDGTTSALIGANAFLDELLAYTKKCEADDTDTDFRQADVMKDLGNIKDQIINKLLKSKDLHMIDTHKEVNGHTDIWKIANVASNGNEDLADIIDTIYKETANPNIYVTYDISGKLSYEIQDGYKFDCKCLNQTAYINDDSGVCKKSYPVLVTIFDHNVTYQEHSNILQCLSKYATALGEEMIIIAPHFDDIMTDVIGTSINTSLQRGVIPNIMMLQFPLTTELDRDYLSDVVLLTNAQVFDYGKVRAFNLMVNKAEHPDEKIEDSLLNIAQYKEITSPEDFIKMCVGTINSLVVGEKYAVIQDYDNVVNQTVYTSELKKLSNAYDAMYAKLNKSSTNLTKEYLNIYQRYTKLKGKMGIIKIGGSSELEKHCLKDSIDDAVLACRSAYENGYIRGLNLSTLSTIDELSKEYHRMLKGTRSHPVKLSGPDLIHATRLYDLTQMFYRVFMKISRTVFENKYHSRIDCKHSTSMKSYSRELKVYDSLSTDEILNKCVTKRLGFNLMTEEFESSYDLWIINSVLTDIEILNAVVSILSLILTSSQFLSVSKGYDKVVSHRQLLDAKCRDEEEIAAAKARGFAKSIDFGTVVARPTIPPTIKPEFTGPDFTKLKSVDK